MRLFLPDDLQAHSSAGLLPVIAQFWVEHNLIISNLIPMLPHSPINTTWRYGMGSFSSFFCRLNVGVSRRKVRFIYRWFLSVCSRKAQWKCGGGDGLWIRCISIAMFRTLLVLAHPPPTCFLVLLKQVTAGLILEHQLMRSSNLGKQNASEQ